MKHQDVRNIVLDAYKGIINQYSAEGRQRRDRGRGLWVRERRAYAACGSTVQARCNTHRVIRYCRQPVCPTCSLYWGRRLARQLAAHHPTSGHGDWRAVTLICTVTSHLDEAFLVFSKTRKSLANAIRYRRRRNHTWDQVGIAGSLEIDCFDATDWTSIGPDKREQYKVLGYDPAAAQGPQWVVTIHAIVHLGTVDDEEVRSVLKRVAPVVHMGDLNEMQTLDEAMESWVGYAGKVLPTTSLALGEVRAWPQKVMGTYIQAAKGHSRGRQGFRVMIGPKRPGVVK